MDYVCKTLINRRLYHVFPKENVFHSFSIHKGQTSCDSFWSLFSYYIWNILLLLKLLIK